MQKGALVNSTTHTHSKNLSRLRERTDRAWFSHLVRHPARKWSRSILTTLCSTRGSQGSEVTKVMKWYSRMTYQSNSSIVHLNEVTWQCNIFDAKCNTIETELPSNVKSALFHIHCNELHRSDTSATATVCHTLSAANRLANRTADFINHHPPIPSSVTASIPRQLRSAGTRTSK